MFETILASTGVGAARIDLVLDKPHVKMGQKVTGKIVMTGGKSKQTIEGLSINFQMQSIHSVHSEQIKTTISTTNVIQDDFTLQPEEEKILPFSFTCPQSLPVSSPTTKYYFDTDLEIKWGIDSHDRDYIDVWPYDSLGRFLEAFTLLDFQRVWEGLYKNGENWAQQFFFQPTHEFSQKVETIMICFTHHTEEQINGLFQVHLNHHHDGDRIMEMIDLEDNDLSTFTLHKGQLSTREDCLHQIQLMIKKQTV